MRHNIYLIHITEKANIGYDCFDSHVIIADTPKEARTFCLFGDEGEETWMNGIYSIVKKIGESNKAKGHVLSSFNAG